VRAGVLQILLERPFGFRRRHDMQKGQVRIELFRKQPGALDREFAPGQQVSRTQNPHGPPHRHLNGTLALLLSLLEQILTSINWNYSQQSLGRTELTMEGIRKRDYQHLPCFCSVVRTGSLDVP
jgi:hypothetical protein